MPVWVSTLRIAWFEKSAMYRLPAVSKAMPRGELSFASVARPPSPQGADTQLLFIVPAMVVITPVALSILRMSWLLYSAM